MKLGGLRKMIIIHYKYNAGDVVKFKDKFHSPTCGLVGREGTTAKIAGRALPYNNRPHYYLEGEEAIFPETCFAGLATEPVNSLSRDEAVGADTLQGPETKYDTGDSGEFEVLPLEEAKWYRISFSAKLTPDDLRAMKKCFFDAMNESMEIYDLDGLVIEEA
jgi:hypothetical protein